MFSVICRSFNRRRINFLYSWEKRFVVLQSRSGFFGAVEILWSDRSYSALAYSVLYWPSYLNPLNAELNLICHLLMLLGDLKFMGPCIVSIWQYISNKMQRYTVYLYLETALHVSGGTSTHHQERIRLCLQHLVFVTSLLLSAAIVEELEPVWVWCGRLPR